MPPENPHHSRRWAVLAILGIAQLMVVLDATIVNIALPSAQRDLGFSDDSRQWIITAYALAFGSLLLLGGRLSDLFGRKWTFVAGLGGFAVASAVGGFAGSFGVLVGARAAQGAFGALLAPAALSLLTTTFSDGKERATAFGVFGAIAGSGSAVGLLLGGVLTETLSWRWCLYVNLAFAVPTMLAATAVLVNQAPSVRPRIDVPGTVLAFGGLFLLVFGFNHAETASWGNAATLAMFAGSVVLLGTFVAVERRVAHPLLPLHVVLDRNRGGAYLALGLSGAGIFSVFLFLTYFLQQSLGFSPIQTGLAFLPMTAAIMITATTVSTQLAPRVGARPLISGGMLLGAVGMAFLTRIDLQTSYASGVLPALLILGVGLGMIFATALNGATRGLEESDAGVGSAMVNTMQQIGGSIGTALLSTIVADAASDYATSHRPGPSLAAAASVHGYTVAFAVAAGIFAVGAVVSGLLLEPHAATAETTDETRAPVLVH